MLLNPVKALGSLFSSSETQTTRQSLNSSLPFWIDATDKEKQATVDQPIRPGAPGRVKFQGSWWPALCEENMGLVQGEVVRVVGIRNITLLVEPV
jgi:membrane protein implicated in regulation of membrane protease activity